MNMNLRRILYFVLTLGVVTLRPVLVAADSESVAVPLKRQEVLDSAKSLIMTKVAASITKDPFHSESYLETLANRVPDGTQGQNAATLPVKVPTGPRSNSDLLQAISASLKPSGFFILSGEPTLVFGEKRVKAGGTLTISFEGSEYTLEITAIDRPNFTLRLNREEITRPIK